MPVQSGFGVNYKASQTNWNRDIAYFNVIGLADIRVNLVQIPQPWASGTPAPTGSYADVNAYWRLCAQTFHEAGFFVTWGSSSPQNNNLPISSTNWSLYRDAVISEATYLQSQGIVLGDFEIGNELELQIDGSLTIAQINANLRTLATDVKAVYTLSPVSYGSSNNSTTVADWITNGKGGLDTISFHPYQTVTSPTTISTNGYSTTSTNIFNTFGNSSYLSEFNLDANATSLATLQPPFAVSFMNTMYSTLIGIGFQKTFLYSWVGSLNANNNFAQLYTSGSMNPMWFDFFTSQPMYYTPRSTSVSRGSTPNRSSTPSRGSTPTRSLIFS